MKKLIIGIVALLLLGGGGAGAFFYFKNPAEASLPPAEKSEDHADAKKEAKGGHGEAAAEKGPLYVKLAPLVVPIMDSEGVSQVISMVIAIEVPDEDSSKKVEALTPRIRDAYIQDLYGLLNERAALENGVVKIGYVKQRLSAATEKVLGPGIAKDVLLQMVQQSQI